jgi:hypothetical protein
VKVDGKPGPWIAGMTLDPSATSEAWCHQRGYVCFIQELHGKPIKKGESFGAAYVVGYFDDVAEMKKTYDKFRGMTGIEIEGNRFKLVKGGQAEGPAHFDGTAGAIAERKALEAIDELDRPERPPFAIPKQ